MKLDIRDLFAQSDKLIRHNLHKLRCNVDLSSLHGAPPVQAKCSSVLSEKTSLSQCHQDENSIFFLDIVTFY